MTAEQATLQELGMTPAQLKEKGEKASALANGNASSEKLEGDALIDHLAGQQRPRRPRSDKGIKKGPKKAEAQLGALTLEQRAEIVRLVEARDRTLTELSDIKAEWTKISQDVTEASIALETYLDSLTAK